MEESVLLPVSGGPEECCAGVELLEDGGAGPEAGLEEDDSEEQDGSDVRSGTLPQDSNILWCPDLGLLLSPAGHGGAETVV